MTYIPIDLNDCFKELDHIIDTFQKESFMEMTEDEFTIHSHWGFGTWMRNNWGLWGSSILKTYFLDLGVDHPDDMSSIILTSYYKYLHGQDINIEEQVKHYTKQ